jgi:hypothetical protein
MALNQSRFVSIIGLVWILFLALIPSHAYAAGADTPSDELPTLEEFAAQVKNGKEDELRGAYAPDLFAFQVVQQPSASPLFVSQAENTLTQFALAADQYDSIGLLAHNYLAGAGFPLLEAGQKLHLIYGDGRVKTFIIRQKLGYQALQPESPKSDFIDLLTGERLSASQLAWKIYNRPGEVILQTCISANGDPSWGRLFVIAEPYEEATE